MKKLLNLLSVLTITGTTMPTTIAASPYQKQEKNNYLIKNNFIEKLYNEDYTWTLSLVLTKNKLLEIIKLFLSSNKNSFILELNKIILKIKENNSILLSSRKINSLDINSFAYLIWKNFGYYYYLFWNLGINQSIRNILYINKNNEYIKKNEFTEIIGIKTELEKKQQNFKKVKNKTKNIEHQCKNKKNSELNKKYNLVEKSTSTKIKIRINKITLAKIKLLFFVTKQKDLFVRELTKLFLKFPPSYNNYSYKLNKEELKSFAYLIWNNFSYYYNLSWNLGMNESIRIISYTGYPEGYWKNYDFESYNEIIDQNTDIIDWQTFNNRNEKNTKENKQFNKKFKHDNGFKKLIEKRQNPTPEPQPGPSGLQPTPKPKIDLFDSNLRIASIDLRNNMPIPMEIQEKDSWCSITVLQNILANNQIRNPNVNNLSQQQLANLFNSSEYSVNNDGLYFFSIYRFIMENNFIKDSLGFNYSYLFLESLFFYSLDDEKKLILLQNLIWESLSRSTPVPAGIFLDDDDEIPNSHAILITGIQPNIDPLQTIYFIRDPEPDSARESIYPGDELNTDTSLNGKELFSMLFYQNYQYGHLLLNSEVYLQFIVTYIKYYNKIWNFQNLLAPIIDFSNPYLFSDDSSDDEENLLANTCFDFSSDSD